VDSEQDLKLSSEDLKKASKELSDLLCIDESTDDKAMTKGFESILVRIEEFKNQLDVMQDKVTSSSVTLGEVYKETEQLKDLFKKIDDVERFVRIVGSNVDEMEAFLERTEKEIDPGRMKKVLNALPGFLRPKSLSSPPPAANSDRKFSPPKVFSSQDFFLQEST
jgi:cappuccino protein